MGKDCSRCGLANPPEALRCDRGYDFALRKVAESYLTGKDLRQRAREAEAQEEGMRVLGLFWRIFRLFR